jgi:hypothetical protein
VKRPCPRKTLVAVIGLMVGLIVAAGVALGGPMPWTPWRLSPAPAASLRATVLPPPDLSFGTVEVDRFSGQLRYAIPLDPLPARPGASPALALTYQPMAQEGLGQGWSWALPSVQLSPDVSAGALRARKKNSPFTLGHVSGLHWNGYRLIYQGSMALSEIEALHSSAYHFQSNAPVQMYAVDGRPTVSLDVISLVASSCSYYRGHIEQRAAQ